MKRISGVLLSLFIVILPGVSTISRSAELTPLVGVSVFGGAERGPAGKKLSVYRSIHRLFKQNVVLADVVGLGGFELLGVLPLSRQFGLQGSYSFTGQDDGYRLGVSFGPLISYSAGKFGLFVDYEYRQEPLGEIRSNIANLRIRGNWYQNFIYLRGVWTHYFEIFDLVLSYTHPVIYSQDSSATHWDSRRSPACFPKKFTL